MYMKDKHYKFGDTNWLQFEIVSNRAYRTVYVDLVNHIFFRETDANGVKPAFSGETN